ncbi:hypothetical protein FQN57_004044 [Myotisia sp. PD_48]|nr:hypothetical protein FQN57_004044 [Myotisia sp. PD_48]
MEPLSITSSAASLLISCGKLVHVLCVYIDETKNIDETLVGLSTEVQTLSGVLQTVSDFWKPSSLPCLSDHTAGISRALQTILGQAQITLDRLEEKLNISGNKISKQFKLSLGMSDIELMRGRIQSHISGATLAIQTIHLHVTISSLDESNAESGVMFRLQGILHKNEKILVQIEEFKQLLAKYTVQDSTQDDHSNQELIETKGVIDNLEKLVANTTAYTSSICEGGSTTFSVDSTALSNLGGWVASEKERQIGDWVSETNMLEFVTEVSQSSAVTSVDHDDTISLKTRTDATEIFKPEDEKRELIFQDILIILQRFQSLLDAGNVPIVELYARAFRSQTSLVLDSNIQQVEQYYSGIAFKSLIDILGMYSDSLWSNGLLGSSVLSLLAKTYLKIQKFSEGLEHCKASLDLRKKVFGARHPLYLESAELLVVLYRESGQHQKADEARREHFSADQMEFLENLDNLEKLLLCHDPTASRFLTQMLVDLYGAEFSEMESEVARIFDPDVSGFHDAILGFESQGLSLLLILAARDDFMRITLLIARGNATRQIKPGASRSVLNQLLPVAISQYNTERVYMLSYAGASNDTLSGEILDAATVGLTPKVELLLLGGADIDDSNENGQSAIFYAVKGGHAKTVKFLVERGAKVDRCDTSGLTPLCFAILNNRPAMIELLLATAKFQNWVTEKALMTAVRNGKDTAARRLLQHGVSIEAVGIATSDILIAAKNGDYEIAKLLLERGGSIKANDQAGGEILRLASSKGKRELVSLLLEKGADIESADPRKDTPLICASENGHYEIVKLLLNKRAKVYPGSPGWSPLAVASASGHYEIVKLLLAKEAYVHSNHLHTVNPLTAAARNGRHEIINLLLENGANIESTEDSSGNTPLLCAVVKKRYKTVEYLLERGANPLARNKEGYNALTKAAKDGIPEIVRTLLGKGRMDVNARDGTGRTALDHAGPWDESRVILRSFGAISASNPIKYGLFRLRRTLKGEGS